MLKNEELESIWKEDLDVFEGIKRRVEYYLWTNTGNISTLES